MKMRMGRIGLSEAVCVAAIALSTGGVFGIDPVYAYLGGNSTYISMPLSIIVSLLIMLPVLKLMDATKCRDISELFLKSAGRAGGIMLMLPICAALLICAAKPLMAFAQVLHRMVYDGVKYSSIIVFMFPVAVFMAWKGLETVGRTAKCIAVLPLVALAAAVMSSASGFEIYRLFPLVGDGMKHFVLFAVSDTFVFIPPIAGLLICGEALGGNEFIRKAAVRSAFIAFAVCFIAQLAISLSFRSGLLAESVMPLYKIGFLTAKQSFVLRLDKLFIMIWLCGALVSCAYCIYSSSLFFSKMLSQKDVTASVAASSLITCTLLLEIIKVDNAVVEKIRNAISYYGALFLIIPLAAVCLLTVIKKRAGRLEA